MGVLKGLVLGAVLAAGASASVVFAQPAPDPIGGVLQGILTPKEPAKGDPTEAALPKSGAQPDVVVEPLPEDVTEAALPGSASARRPKEPPKRKRYAVAVIQALDKITAETMRFEAPVNQPVRYKTLIFTVRTCETSASNEPVRDSIAHIQIDSQPVAVAGRPAVPGRQLFKGWMFASTPGLNPFQHPVYDAWLIACKTAVPGA